MPVYKIGQTSRIPLVVGENEVLSYPRLAPKSHEVKVWLTRWTKDCSDACRKQPAVLKLQDSHNGVDGERMRDRAFAFKFRTDERMVSRKNHGAPML
jgi:hypothetical protein